MYNIRNICLFAKNIARGDMTIIDSFMDFNCNLPGSWLLRGCRGGARNSKQKDARAKTCHRRWPLTFSLMTSMRTHTRHKVKRLMAQAMPYIILYLHFLARTSQMLKHTKTCWNSINLPTWVLFTTMFSMASAVSFWKFCWRHQVEVYRHAEAPTPGSSRHALNRIHLVKWTESDCIWLFDVIWCYWMLLYLDLFGLHGWSSGEQIYWCWLAFGDSLRGHYALPSRTRWCSSMAEVPVWPQWPCQIMLCHGSMARFWGQDGTRNRKRDTW